MLLGGWSYKDFASHGAGVGGEGEIERGQKREWDEWD